MKSRTTPSLFVCTLAFAACSSPIYNKDSADEQVYGILGDASKPGRYPCLRWAGLRVDDLDVVARMEKARDVESFLAEQARLTLLTLHAVVGDRSGRIGHTLSGRVEERPPGWDGAGPAPGWDVPGRDPRPLPDSSRPLRIDPPEGLLVFRHDGADGLELPGWAAADRRAYGSMAIELLRPS